MKKRILCTLILMFALISPAMAHPGGVDEAGGHHDHENVSGLGSYHYHHGYLAHLHENGVCPYEKAEPSEDEYDPFEDESTDGSYAEAFNAGFDKYLCEYAEKYDQTEYEVPIDYLDELRENWFETGDETLLEEECTYGDAFYYGYTSAENAIFYGWTTKEDLENEISSYLQADAEPELSEEIEEETVEEDNYDYHESDTSVKSESIKQQPMGKILSNLALVLFGAISMVGVPIVVVEGCALFYVYRMFGGKFSDWGILRFVICDSIFLLIAYIIWFFTRYTGDNLFDTSLFIITLVITTISFALVAAFEKEN